MSTYKVKSNLKHDGRDYSKGDEVELKEAEAEVLLKDGIVVDLNASTDEDDDENIQPPVNNVKREGDNVGGEKTVEQGKVDQPQPGDNTDDSKDNGDNDDTGSGDNKGDDKSDNL